jgi:hypothetical protein
MGGRNRGTERRERGDGSGEPGTSTKPGHAIRGEEVTGPVHWLYGALRRHSLSILLFLVALFFIITISMPALYTNDEWISTNQLHQLDIGHQATVNEGKYGTFLNGTPGPYFSNLNNVLTYSLMLPVLALPAIKLFGLFGDSFRLVVILLWASIPLVIALMIETCYPRYASFRGIRVTFCAILFSFGLLLLNLLLYSPFIFLAPDAPVEAAALMFTNHLLFAALVVIVYHICLNIFEDQWKSLLGAFLCIACSSYIFWAGTVKDHILTAVIFALVIFFIVSYLRSDSWYESAAGFLCIGLLAWARPEVGFTVAVFAGLFIVCYQANRIRCHRIDLHGALRALSSVFIIIIGSIPLIINNLVTTGKLLVPIEFSHTAAGVFPASSVVSPVPGVISPGPGILASLGDIARMISWNYIVPWDTLSSDIPGFMTYPGTAGSGFLVVCPLAFLAAVLVIYALWKKQAIPAKDKFVLVFLAFMTIAIVLAYVKNFHVMAVDPAMVPDIRYLMPAYLPAGLLGVYMLYLNAFPARAEKTLVWLIVSSVVCVPLVIIGIIAFPPISEKFGGYPIIFNYAVTLVTILFAAGLMLSSFRKHHIALLTGCFILLVILILSWQMMMVFLYSAAKFNGYTFWIPAIDTLFYRVFSVHYLP